MRLSEDDDLDPVAKSSRHFEDYPNKFVIAPRRPFQFQFCIPQSSDDRESEFLPIPIALNLTLFRANRCGQ